jgi:apolipoprotein N-acyltransferase
VLLEWLRGWLLTGFNWNELGDSQAPSIVFRQLAAYGGVHLISFLLVAVNILWAESALALAEGWRGRRPFRLPPAFMAGLLITASAFALGWHHLLRHRGETPGPALSFACVQPNIPQLPYDGGPWINFQHKEDEALATQVQLSRQALAGHPRLLVWPEATIDEGVFQDAPMNEAVHAICEENDGYFLLGSQDLDLDRHQLFNAAYIFSPGGERYDEYRKTRLVVLGEYLPFGDRFPWLRHALGIGMDFTPGDAPKVFTLADPAVRLAPMICFEDTLPSVAQRAAELQPDAFVTITNDGWYQGWCAAWGLRQHLANAVFRCVEQDRPMIRCANNGISCLIDADGTVASRLRDARGGEIDVGGVFTGTLQTCPAQRTLYEAAGEWIVLLSGLVGVMLTSPFLLRPSRFRP